MRKGGCKAIGVLVLLCIGVLPVGCGYRFSGGGTLPGSAGSVFVAMLENRTAESGIEHIYTNDLIYEFSRNGQQVVAREAADVILTGSLDAVSIDTVAYRGQITSVGRRIRAWMSLKLMDRNGKTAWSGAGITDEETYSVTDDKMATEYNKRLAIESLSRRMAEESYSRMTAGF